MDVAPLPYRPRSRPLLCRFSGTFSSRSAWQRPMAMCTTASTQLGSNFERQQSSKTSLHSTCSKNEMSASNRIAASSPAAAAASTATTCSHWVTKLVTHRSTKSRSLEVNTATLLGKVTAVVHVRCTTSSMVATVRLKRNLAFFFRWSGNTLPPIKCTVAADLSSELKMSRANCSKPCSHSLKRSLALSDGLLQTTKPTCAQSRTGFVVMQKESIMYTRSTVTYFQHRCGNGTLFFSATSASHKAVVAASAS